MMVVMIVKSNVLLDVMIATVRFVKNVMKLKDIIIIQIHKNVKQNVEIKLLMDKNIVMMAMILNMMVVINANILVISIVFIVIKESVLNVLKDLMRMVHIV